MPYAPETLIVPIALMGDSSFARCLQGGGVNVQGGTVAISSCAISGNTARNVRAHIQEFPSPPCETHVFACCLQGGGVYIQGGTVTISSSTISGNTAPTDSCVRAHPQKFALPLWETHVLLVVCRVVVSLSLLAQ